MAGLSFVGALRFLLFPFLVPTLCVGTHFLDALRPGMAVVVPRRAVFATQSVADWRSHGGPWEQVELWMLVGLSSILQPRTVYSLQSPFTIRCEDVTPKNTEHGRRGILLLTRRIRRN